MSRLRRRAAAALALATGTAAVVGVVWWASGGRSPALHDHASGARIAASAAEEGTEHNAGVASSAAETRARGGAGKASARDPADAAARLAAASAPPTTNNGVWELCGIGRVPRPAGAAPGDLPAPLGDNAFGLWNERWQRQLAVGPPRAQALRLLMQAAGADPNVLESVRQTLAGLAQWIDDPVVLHWALSICGENPQAPCGALSAQRLVALAPDSIPAWALYARQRPDRALAVTAGLAAATDLGGAHRGQAALTALQTLPADMPAYLRPGLLVRAISAESLIEFDDLRRIRDPLCAPSAVKDPARRAACEAVALRAAQVDGTSALSTVGSALGPALGWPRELVERERRQAEERARVGAWRANAAMDPEHPGSCESVRRLEDWVRAGAAPR